MGKKQRDEAPNPTNIANRDIIQRLNFLYQASVYLKGVGEPSSSRNESQRPQAQPSQRPKRRKRTRNMIAADLSTTYIEDMKVVGKKALVRIDPTVKRTLCKRCNVVMVPGVTASVRIKGSSSHGHAVTYSCLDCNTARRIPAPPVADQTTYNAADPFALPSKPDEDELPGSKGLLSNDDPMDGTAPATRHSRRKKKVQPRTPPLFERNVGHVIFRGNERFGTTEDRSQNIIHAAQSNQ